MASMSAVEPTKAHCNGCARETHHKVLNSVTRRWDYLDDDGSPYAHEQCIYDTLQCCGCDEVRLRLTESGPYPTEPARYYPPATFRPKPSWLNDLILDSVDDDALRAVVALLNEVYKALQADMPRLAAMGVRAVLEAIMLDKIGDHGRFKDNVKAFEEAGYIGKLQKERIDQVLDAGSAAIHRRYLPTPDDVVAMLNLAEHLVESTYVHERQIRGIASRVPARPARANKTPSPSRTGDEER